MHVKKGDKVQVITGKDKGKQGVILVAFPKQNRVIVEGVNIVKKHSKPSQLNPQGGIKSYVEHLNRSKQPIHEEPVYVEGSKDGIHVYLQLLI
ncbi:50S ribosomal protein L24 [Bacillus sp. SS-TM]